VEPSRLVNTPNSPVANSVDGDGYLLFGVGRRGVAGFDPAPSVHARRATPMCATLIRAHFFDCAMDPPGTGLMRKDTARFVLVALELSVRQDEVVGWRQHVVVCRPEAFSITPDQCQRRVQRASTNRLHATIASSREVRG